MAFKNVLFRVCIPSSLAPSETFAAAQPIRSIGRINRGFPEDLSYLYPSPCSRRSRYFSPTCLCQELSWPTSLHDDLHGLQTRANQLRLIYIECSTFSEIPINVVKPPRNEIPQSTRRRKARCPACRRKEVRSTITRKQRRFRLLIRVFLHLRWPRENLMDLAEGDTEKRGANVTIFSR